MAVAEIRTHNVSVSVAFMGINTTMEIIRTYVTSLFDLIRYVPTLINTLLLEYYSGADCLIASR